MWLYIRHYFLTICRSVLGIMFLFMGLAGFFGASPGGSISGVERLTLMPIFLIGIQMFIPSRIVLRLNKVKLYHWFTFIGFLPQILYQIYLSIRYGYNDAHMIIFFLLFIYAITHLAIVTRRQINDLNGNYE